jgi:hypothetical protein
VWQLDIRQRVEGLRSPEQHVRWWEGGEGGERGATLPKLAGMVRGYPEILVGPNYSTL